MPTVVQTTILTADNRISPVLEKIGTDTGLLKVKMQADFALISKSVEALNEQLGGTSSAITAKLAQTATAVDGSSTTMGTALGKVETRANSAAGALRGTAKGATSLGEGLTAAAGGTDVYAKSIGQLNGLTESLNTQLTTFNERLAGVNQQLLDTAPLAARTGETNALTAATERATVAQRTLNKTPSAPPGGLTPQARYDYMRGRPIAEPRPTRAVYEGVGGVASGAQRVGLGVTAASAFGLYEVSQFFKGGVAAAASANLSPAVEKAMENAVLKLYSKTPVGFAALFQMFQSAAETFQQGGKSNQQYIKELTQIVMAGLRSAVGTGAQQPEVISQALARVLHGFSIPATKAEKVMDILHSVAAYSGAGTRVETLAQNMARSSALAPIVGISLPQWGSLYAELSKQFRPQQSDTLLRQLEQNIRAGTKGEGSQFMKNLGLTTAPSKFTGADLPVNLWSTQGIKKYGIYNVIEMLQQRVGEYVHRGFISASDAQVGLTRLAPQLRGGSALAYLMTPGRLDEARRLGGRLGAEQGPPLPGGIGTDRVATDVKGVTERYFKEMMKQPGAQLTVAWHDIVVTAIKLGEVLAPAAERAAKQLERLTKIIEPWISKHPSQTTTIAEAGIGALIAGYFVKQGLGAGKSLVNLFTGTSGLLGYRVGAAGVGAGAGGAEGAAALGTAGSAGIGAAIIGGVALYLVSAFKGQEFQQATAQAGLGAAIASWWKSNIIDKVLTVLGMGTPGIAPGTALAAISKAGGPGAVMGGPLGALGGTFRDVGGWTTDQTRKLTAFFNSLPGLAQQGMGRMGTIIGNLLGSIGHDMDLAGVQWTGKLGNLLNMRLLENYAATTGSALSATWKNIGSALGGLVSQVSSGLGQIGKSWQDLEHVWNISGLKSQLDQWGAANDKAMRPVMAGLEAAKTSIGNTLKSIWSMTGFAQLPTWGSELLTLPGKIGEAWSNTSPIAAGARAMGSYFQELGKELGATGHQLDLFIGSSGSVKEKGLKAFGDLASGAATSLGSIGHDIGHAVSGWAAQLDKIHSVDLLGNYAQSIGPALGSIGSFISKANKELNNWLSSALPKGGNFVTHLADGITAKSDALTRAVTSAVESAWSAASKWLSSHNLDLSLHLPWDTGPGHPQPHRRTGANTASAMFPLTSPYAVETGAIGSPSLALARSIIDAARPSPHPHVTPSPSPGKAAAVTVRIQAGPSTQLNPTGSMVYVPGGPPAPIFTVTAPRVRPPRTARPPAYGAPYAGDLGPFTVGPAGRAAFGEEPGVLAAYQKFIASVEKLPRDLQGYMEKAAQTFRTSLNTEERLHNKNLGTLTATYNAKAQGYYQLYNQNVGRIVTTGQEASLYQATRVNISMSRANQMAIVSAQTLEGNHEQQINTLKRQRSQAIAAAQGGKNVQYPWMDTATGNKTPDQIWQDFQGRINDANKSYTRSMHALEQRLGITGSTQAKGFEAWLSHQDFSSKTRMSTAWDTYQRELKSLNLAYYGPGGSIGKENDRHGKAIAKLTTDLEKASKPAQQWVNVSKAVSDALKTWGEALRDAILTGASTTKDLARIVKASIAQARLDLISGTATMMTQQALAGSGKYLDLKANQALIDQQTANAQSRQQIGISARELDDPNYIFALANKERYGATTSLQDAQKKLGVDQLLAGDDQYLGTLVETTKVTAQDNILIAQRTLLSDQLLNADRDYLANLVTTAKLTEEDNLLVSQRNLLTAATLSVDEQHLTTLQDQAKVDAGLTLVKQQESNTVAQRLLQDRQWLAIQAATQLATVRGNTIGLQQSAITTSILSQSKEYLSAMVAQTKASLDYAIAQAGLNLTVAGMSMDLHGIGEGVTQALESVIALWQQAVASGAGYMNQYTGTLIQAAQEQAAVTDANNRSNIIVGLLTGSLSSLTSGLQGLFGTANDQIGFWAAALGRGVDGINIARGNILDLGKDAIKAAGNLGSLSDVIGGLTQVVSSIGGAAGTEFMRTGAISPTTMQAYGTAHLALTQASWDQVSTDLQLARGSNDLQAYIAALGNEIDLYKKKLGSDIVQYGAGSPQVAADQSILQGLIKEFQDMSAALTVMESTAEDNAKALKVFTDAVDAASLQLSNDKADLASRLSSDNSAITDAKSQLARDIAEGPERNSKGIVTPAAQETYDNTIRADQKRISDAQKQQAKDLEDGNRAIAKDTTALGDATKALSDYRDSIANGIKDFGLLRTNGIDPAMAALQGLTAIIVPTGTNLAASLTTAGQGATDLGTTLSKLGVDLTTLDTGIKDLASIIADAVKAIGNAIAGLGGGGAGAVGEGGGSAEVGARSGGAILSPLEKAYAGFQPVGSLIGSLGGGTGTATSSGGITSTAQTAPSLTTIASGFPQTVTGAVGSTSPLITVANALPQTFTGLVSGGETSAGGTSTTSAGTYMKVVNDDGSVSYVWMPSSQTPSTSTAPTSTGYNGLTGYTGLPSIGGTAASWSGGIPTDRGMIDSALTALPSITSPGGTWAGMSHTETNYLGQQSYYPSLPPPVSPTSGTKDPTSLLNQIADNTGQTATNTNAINNMDPAAVAMQLRTLLQNLINVAPAQSAIRVGNVKAGIDELINELGTTTTSQAL